MCSSCSLHLPEPSATKLLSNAVGACSTRPRKLDCKKRLLLQPTRLNISLSLHTLSPPRRRSCPALSLSLSEALSLSFLFFHWDLGRSPHTWCALVQVLIVQLLVPKMRGLWWGFRVLLNSSHSIVAPRCGPMKLAVRHLVGFHGNIAADWKQGPFSAL